MSSPPLRIPPGAFALAVVALTLVPLIELGLLVVVAGQVGVVPTLVLCALTGLVGAWLARWQGLRTVIAAQAALQEGRFPGEQVLDGAFLLAGGVVLLTPGLLTDIMGFAFLIPPTRSALKTLLRRWWDSRTNPDVVEGVVIEPHDD